MKYLIVLAVVVVAIWIWRQNRREEAQERAAARPRAVPGPQAMLRCAHCGVHLPAADAVAGRQGSYCSETHRRLGET